MELDLPDTFDLKLAALACHKSQVAGFGPGMKDMMRQWAEETARKEKYELAEAFHRVDMWW